MSSTSCVRLVAYASILLLMLGTIAMLEVIAPSIAFSVETTGCCSPFGHNVRYPRGPCGTTVALKTYACAASGGSHTLTATSLPSVPLNNPPVWRVSSTRQGADGYSDSPPTPGAAKYPLISITRSVGLVTKMAIAPLAPARTNAALATTVPVIEFRVETKGWGFPAGHVVR